MFVGVLLIEKYYEEDVYKDIVFIIVYLVEEIWL